MSRFSRKAVAQISLLIGEVTVDSETEDGTTLELLTDVEWHAIFDKAANLVQCGKLTDALGQRVELRSSSELWQQLQAISLLLRDLSRGRIGLMPVSSERMESGDPTNQPINCFQ